MQMIQEGADVSMIGQFGVGYVFPHYTFFLPFEFLKP
jgi:hypothetical protein